MPTTRRSTGGSRARSGPTKGQSTISFASRVTKAVPKDAKAAALDNTSTKAVATEPAKAHIKDEEPEEISVKEIGVEDENGNVGEELAEGDVPPVAQRTESELRAEQISDKEITKYWAGIQKMRRAKPVHQEDLTQAEKILRYFDMSSQYGPCIGIDRTKRWARAERLGLNPPIEVLAVLLKEQEKSHTSSEKAYMDGLVNNVAEP